MKEFADQLRAIREAKQISLTDIASTTKIQLKYLRAMEEGDFSFLPLPYVRAFVRDYAKALDLDPAETLRQFDAAFSPIESPVALQPAVKKTTRVRRAVEDEMAHPPRGILRSLWLSFREFLKQDRTRKKLVPAVSAVILLFALLFIANMTRRSSGNSPQEIPFEQIIREKEGAASTHPDSAGAPDRHLAGIFGVGDSLALEARTTRRVWMRLVIDDRQPLEYLFPEHSQRTWKARQKFDVTLGDAGGISFKLNGKDLGTLGSSGAVVRNVVITQGGIQKETRITTR